MLDAAGYIPLLNAVDACAAAGGDDIGPALIQRRMQVGFAEAAQILDALEQARVLGAAKPSGRRPVLITDPDEAKARVGDAVCGIERDTDGYWTGNGGHLWKESRGPDSACARPGCGHYYSHWSGDRCPAAPDCTAMRGDIRCQHELGHADDGQEEHSATVTWS